MITCVSIAKNETNNLERFFDSLDGLHDRLVLVDTGSKDCTKAMATKLGAEVHEIPFTNFGDTRNRAAEIAKDSDWLVMFDCDEVLYDAPKLRERLLSLPDSTVGASIKQTSHGNSFRRRVIWRPGHGKWKHRIHEHLHVDGPCSHYEDIRIDHPGYHGRSGDIYIPLLLEDAKDNPRDATRQYYLGRQLYYAKDPQGIAPLLRCAQHSRWKYEKAMALVFAGRMVVEHVGREMALHLFRDAIEAAPDLRDGYYELAWWSTNPYEKIVAATKAMKCKGRPYFDTSRYMYTEKAEKWLMNKIESF